MSKLFFDKRPLVVNPELAVLIGLNEAIVLQQVHYWVRVKRLLDWLDCASEFNAPRDASAKNRHNEPDEIKACPTCGYYDYRDEGEERVCNICHPEKHSGLDGEDIERFNRSHEGSN